MQFIVTGFDAEDDKALERRTSARDAHLKLVEEMIEKGHDLYAAALLDESGNMKGSMMVVEFPSKNELDAWLEIEPYIVNNVWQRVEIVECKVPPLFMK